ncbi:hypothetical protein HBI56_009540 [Parastagonospora nodorum]|uniref:Uncharacterized protein n=1 Tax=Phaeosphaeria nodorum (strain SN15 / ATCC MYA-4574 / FGSC 10173) TaxID=321614 RepID=A0A7U2ETP9_PHANO|nr:hypothetical protein HBH56_012190 [Parastagonospora nodorum]QRC90874.1 hypothetical protein JI435_400640 [Parastagonospora nodorum SN15]KAH3935080.1 hypothetical protein HBH54_045490 [Parastagonospora nodorum]KAH3950255.1 hypothetical protein HBH53_078240 [Parastagonospora nodorum]KAH3987203.1 hypothetical protein HBH51_011290 [Parastagonospora nodorum]
MIIATKYDDQRQGYLHDWDPWGSHFQATNQPTTHASFSKQTIRSLLYPSHSQVTIIHSLRIARRQKQQLGANPAFDSLPSAD